jgi:lysyl-tRNA synthetase class 1
MAVMLKSLREERQQSYSIFLPISPQTGRVLYVPIKRHVDPVAAGTVTFDDEDGTETTLPVTGGNVKLQWKPDFGARWAALDVDFEMYGKEHATNTPIYDRICEILGGRRRNISPMSCSSTRTARRFRNPRATACRLTNGCAMPSTESLSYFMYQKPKTAKRMYFDVIPKAVDEYHQQLRAYPGQDARKAPGQPGLACPPARRPQSRMVVPFAMLAEPRLGLGATDKDALWGFIRRYAPDASPATHPDLDAAAGFAVRYFNDFVLPERQFRAPDATERAAMEDLADG